MIYRRYKLDDIEQMIPRIRQMLSQTRYSRLTFEKQKIRNLLEGNVNNSQFFCDLVVLDDDTTIVGGLCASIMAFIFSYDAVAYDHFFYIAPEHRDATAATTLVERYLLWAADRKVKEALLQNITGERVDAYSRFAERLGFKLIGSSYSKEF